MKMNDACAKRSPCLHLPFALLAALALHLSALPMAHAQLSGGAVPLGSGPSLAIPQPKARNGRAANANQAPAIAGACTLIINNFTFGRYVSGQATSLNGSWGMTVNCDSFQTITATVTPSNGTGNYFLRLMNQVGGDDTLGYQLYTDWNHTTIWGDGTQATSPITNSGAGVVVLDVFGKVGASQNIRPGSYEESIVVTVEP